MLNRDKSPWTTVQRRCARSFSPPGKTQTFSKKDSDSRRKLTEEQAQTVKLATTRLTEQQKEMLRRRKYKVPVQWDSSMSSRGEGPSEPKGKGIDPREWGNVNIRQDSLDIGAQAAALDSIAQQQDRRQRRKTTKKKGNKTDLRSSIPKLPVESRPVAQIATDSYLGTALRNVGHTRHHPSSGGGDSPSPSEPTSDEEDETSSEEGNSSGTRLSSNPRRHWHNRNRWNWKWRRSSSSTTSRVLIKPIAPKDYDGQADACSYYRFVRESEAYLWDGKVKGRRQIFLLSYYLTGKAYDFYTQKIASNEAS